jgi:thioesterase domain-containing protein
MLTGELRAAIASRKQEILAFLRRAETIKTGPRAIVPLKPEGRRPPLFAIPGHNGDVFSWVPLARHLDADQPLLGVQPPGLDGSEPLRSIEALARYDVEQIRRCRAQGPYLIAGYRAGGPIAFEIARQLTEQRQRVALLALVASPFPTFYRRMPEATRRVKRIVRRSRHHWGILMSGTLAERMRYLVDRIRHRHGERRDTDGEVDRELVATRVRLEHVTLAAMRRYRPRPFPGEVDIFLPSRAWRRPSRSDRWRTVARAVRECVCSVADDDNHDALLQEPDVSTLAAALRLRFDEIARLERDHEKAARV